MTFDTGGISMKPAGGMEDMKGDMGGAACVAGLMLALAARKAAVNAVGLIGLTENMPSGKAQRPGDIVTSMSGQTIEVINTDAEGRLVLADVLWYAQQQFKPRFIVDLATLTGAIVMALGKEYAGLFANDDRLAGELSAAGEATGEKVWRMPLAKAYDKMIDSKNADMKNIGGAARRCHHRRAIPATLHQGHGVGPHRHRRHRHGLGPQRHQPELGLGLGRAPARPAGGRQLREGGAVGSALSALFLGGLQAQRPLSDVRIIYIMEKDRILTIHTLRLRKEMTGRVGQWAQPVWLEPLFVRK